MPSKKTATGGASQTALGIRWVFPTARGLLTQLAGERIILGQDDDCQVKLLGAVQPVPIPATAVGSGSVSAPNTPESRRARRERDLSPLTETLHTDKGSVARAAAVGISRQRAYRLVEAGGIAGVGDDPAPGESL